MTLLTALFAALISTVVWYFKDGSNRMQTGTLSLMYWGASLMGLVDAVTEYLQEGAAYFQPAAKDMLNDTFLGVSVVVFGLVIWIVMILVQDPKGILHKKIQ